MVMDAQQSQQRAGLQRAVSQLQQEVTLPNARFKTYLAKEVWGEWGSNQVPTYLRQMFYLNCSYAVTV